MSRCGTLAVCGVLAALAAGSGCIRFNQTGSDALEGGGGGGGPGPTSLSGFRYSMPRAVYPRPPSGDVAIPPNTPSLSGADLEFSVSPALPGGLSLDPATGVISGTPSADSPAAPAFSSYTITADNGTDTADATVEILITTGYVVDSTADAGDDDLNDSECDTAGAGTECTLRAAIEQAADDGGSRAILISDGTYTLTSSVAIASVTLTDLAISGESEAGTIIDGGGAYVPFYTIDANLSLSNLTIQNTLHNSDGGAVSLISTGGPNTLAVDRVTFDGNHSNGWGGAIYIGGSTGGGTITHSTFENNTSVWGGGALDFDSTNPITIEDSVFRGNTSTDNGSEGGAIASSSSGDTHLLRCVFEGNGTTSVNVGGAVMMRGTIRDSYFTGNTARNGGAAITVAGGTLLIERSTFFDNYASITGGALYAMATTTVRNSTFYRNRADFQTGGIVSDNTTAFTLIGSTVVENDGDADDNGSSAGAGIKTNGNATLRENLIAGNHNNGTPTNCQHVVGVTSDGYNLTDTAGGDCDLNGPNDLQDTVTNIAYDTQLRDNGGEVLTLALLSSSVAIDADSHASCPAEDARGIARPRGAACDIGAFEY